MSKTQELVLQIKKLIKEEVKKQVQAQVTQILSEQRLLQEDRRPMSTPARKAFNFNVQFDEPITEDYDMTSIDGILGATQAQMKRDNYEELDAMDETNMFVKDYSAVLKESYKISGT